MIFLFATSDGGDIEGGRSVDWRWCSVAAERELLASHHRATAGGAVYCPLGGGAPNMKWTKITSNIKSLSSQCAKTVIAPFINTRS